MRSLKSEVTLQTLDCGAWNEWGRLREAVLGYIDDLADTLSNYSIFMASSL
ncbi:MAG: hypothetical protein WCK84_02815 [Bacteroidota bacterium]